MIEFLKRNILIPLKEFIFPPLCFSCNELLSENEKRICEKCYSTLIEISENDFTVKILNKRFRELNNIDGFVSLFYFEKNNILQFLAHSLKYDSMTIFGRELGEKLGIKLKEKIKDKIDFTIPIPLHKNKERERGYNQSEFISKGIENTTDIPVLPNLLQRKKNTKTQTKLNFSERQENVSDAFLINPKMAKLVGDKNFLIVDDVITTGATIQEVAKVLKKINAQKIFVASIAIAKLDENENPPVFTEGSVVAGAGLEPTTFGL